ncbi:Aste57867_1116 [Aphanomyces stellatus]|uniref:Aste57867_1116 protein n=1 Tax=Aphanomyces stellatus TaxID=120398 RepID=A0A485K5M5_9STRA|nr:hypothetical protein As57867_001115 [Aphanomyces stellatus]VFT78337.1 Aste57867_1116 [Aphanomyces stellatus]
MRSQLEALPPLVWDAHLAPLLHLSEVMSISVLNRSFHVLLHDDITLHHAVDVTCPTHELVAITDTWRNLRRITYKPFVRSNAPYSNDSVFPVPAPQVDLLEPDQEADIEDHMDRFLDSIIARSVRAFQANEMLTSSLCKIVPRLHALDLSGTHKLELFPGIHRVHHLNLSGSSSIRGLEHISTLSSVDMSYCHDLTDVAPLARVAHIDLSYCHGVSDVSALHEATSLFLNMCKSVVQVHALKHIHTLSLRNCSGVRDVSALSHVHTLILSGCKHVTDVSALTHVHTLHLSGLDIDDVRALGQCYELNLRKCHRITDVSALGQVHTLDLSGCSSLQDVSALGGVHTLNLSSCKLITDVSALLHVPTLSLSNCDSLVNVNSLGAGSVQQLDLSSCRAVVDISALGRIPTLNISRCQGIHSLVGLTHTRDLDMSFCRQIDDLAPLANIQVDMFLHVLNAYRCPRLMDVRPLARACKVNLSCCPGIQDVSPLRHVRELDLRFCDALVDVTPLQHVRVLKLAGCQKLANVSALTHVRHLDLSYCHGIQSVDGLSHVHSLSLRNCSNVHDVSALGRVYALNLSGCELARELRPPLDLTHITKMTPTEDFVETIKAGNDAGGRLHHLVVHIDVHVLCELEDKEHHKKEGTVLMWASAFGRVDVVRLLLARRSDIHVNCTNEFGESALHWASERGHLDVVDVLLDTHGMDVNLVDENGQSALHYASEEDHVDVVRALLHHAIDVNLVDEDGKSALHCASAKGCVQVVRALLATHGIDINAVTEAGSSALQLATAHGHAPVVLALLENNAVDVNFIDKDKKSALHNASMSGYVDIVQALLHFPGIDANIVDKARAERKSALHVASEVGHEQIVKALLAFAPINVNLLDMHRKSALHYASELGHVHIVAALVQCMSVDVNAVAKAGYSALLFACVHGHVDVVQLLVAHVELNRFNLVRLWEGNAALHVAIEKGHVEVVRSLLACDGVDVHLLNGRNLSPMDLAIKHDRYEIVGLLWDSGRVEVDRAHNNDGNILLDRVAKSLSIPTALKLLLLDMPIAAVREGELVPRPNHTFSWTTFLDAAVPIQSNVRLACVQAILARFGAGAALDLAFSKDRHGRDAIHITDDHTRTYFYELLFFCGRYQLMDGPPVHVSPTAVVVLALDHGLCSQVCRARMDGHGELDEQGFIACCETLARVSPGQRKLKQIHAHETESWREEFEQCANDRSTVSERAFLRYCEVHFGKLHVAVKFMRHSKEFSREMNARKKLRSTHVLQKLPALDQKVFEAGLRTLTLGEHGNMAEYHNVLVMPAADRSLEDIYVNERPDGNRTKQLLHQVGLALHYLHDRGLVHGDLKKRNVVRVHDQLKLIDFDATVPIGQPLGGKVSSGILPPEMFCQLAEPKNTRQLDHTKQNKGCQYTVKVYRYGCDPNSLPYSLVHASTAVDMWSFGCMMYEMLSGAELIPTDINQNVVVDYMDVAATWTDAKLKARIDVNIANDWARDLLLQLLVVDPRRRSSTTDVLQHVYFTGLPDTSYLDEVIFDSLLQYQPSEPTTEAASTPTRESNQDEMCHVRKLDSQASTIDLSSGILDASGVPTSFVVVPCHLDEADNIPKVLAFALHLWTTCKQLQCAASSNTSLRSILNGLTADYTSLYLYLIDEESGEVVVPDKAETYPIALRRDTDNDHHLFLLLMLPFIQHGFKRLAAARSTLAWQDTVSSEAVRTILFEPLVSFQMLQEILQVASLRGAALQQLELWFDDHDPTHSFAGLKRVMNPRGRMVWTSADRMAIMEKEAADVTQETLANIQGKLKDAP